MHAILGHDCVPDITVVQRSILWQVFGSRRLWFDVPELAVCAEQGVQGLFGELCGLYARTCRQELDSQFLAWVALEILQPWSAPYQMRADRPERIEPWLGRSLFQILLQRGFDVGWRDLGIVQQLRIRSTFFQPWKYLLD